MSETEETEYQSKEKETEDEKEEKEKEKKVVSAGIAAMLIPFGGKFSFGALVGLCAGYALKKVGKAAALAVGISFLGLQGLAYGGYISINWKEVEKSAIEKLDQDGDGDFDGEDVKIIAHRVYAAIRYQVPGGAGFAIAFLYGFKQGW